MNHRDESGFTMLEILASIAILSIVVIPLMGLMTSAPLLHAQREQQMRAAFLAQLRLEEVKQKITVYFDDDYTKSIVSATDFPDTDFPVSDGRFRYKITDNLGTDMKEITVTVWYDEDSDNVFDTGEQGIGLETKVARRKTVE